MSADFSSLESEPTLLQRFMEKAKKKREPVDTRCSTISRSRFMIDRLNKTKQNLILLGVLTYLTLVLMLIHKKSDFSEYAAVLSTFGLITISCASIDGQLKLFRTYELYHKRKDYNEEPDSVYTQWVESVEKRELKRGTVIFRIFMAITLIFYLLS